MGRLKVDKSIKNLINRVEELMILHDLSLKTSAMIIIIAAGVTILFALSWFQRKNLFAPSITEGAQRVMMMMAILSFNEDRYNRTLAYVTRNDIRQLVDSVRVYLMII